MALLLSQTSDAHEQMVHLWGLPNCAEGSLVRSLYRTIIDRDRRQAFFVRLPSIEQAVYRTVQAEPHHRTTVAHLLSKLPFDQLRLQAALAKLRSSGLLVGDSMAVSIPDELRSSMPPPLEVARRRSTCRVSIANRMRTKIEPGHDAWSAELRRLLHGERSRLTTAKTTTLTSFLRRFALQLDLVGARQAPTSRAEVLLSCPTEVQLRALLEFWLSEQLAEVSSGSHPNLRRYRQRLVADLRVVRAGEWCAAPIDPAAPNRASSARLLRELNGMGAVDLGYDRRGDLVGVRLTGLGGSILPTSRRLTSASDG